MGMSHDLYLCLQDVDRQKLKVELSTTMTKMRRHSLGNIRFIGELFKLKMLSEAIIYEIITRLLKSASDEESLECFSKLITITGKDLEKPETKVGVASINLGVVSTYGCFLAST